MRLAMGLTASARDRSPRVPCFDCGQMLPLCEAVCDLDGPAYRAYYHPHHVPGLEVYDAFIVAGVPIDNHESDLYAKGTPEADEIVRRLPPFQRSTVTRFESEIDGAVWIEIPFAFRPWWERRLNRGA